MNANPILLQKKYARVIACFARCMTLSLDFFFCPEVHQLLQEGVPDLHCMSSEYLAEELQQE